MRKQCVPGVSPPPSQTPGYEANFEPWEPLVGLLRRLLGLTVDMSKLVTLKVRIKMSVTGVEVQIERWIEAPNERTEQHCEIKAPYERTEQRESDGDGDDMEADVNASACACVNIPSSILDSSASCFCK